MASSNFDSTASEHIIHDMWEKWVFLASLAASTSLMRAAVGHILAAPNGQDFMKGMLDECSAVAAAEGYAPRAPFLERSRGMLLTEGSQLTASMYRDIKAGAPVEADHVIGDLMVRGDASKVPVPKLRVAYTHLKAYENQRG
jgi:2-dehydropantoate 2-reductase